MGQIVAYAYEHSCQYQHNGYIERDDSFKEKLLEKVGSVTHQVKDEGKSKDSQDDAKKTATKDEFNYDCVTTINSGFVDAILLDKTSLIY